MASNIYNFVYSIINNPNLSDEQKEEIGNLLVKSNNEYKFTPEEKFHNPMNMVSFLEKFSKDETFKWFTHAPQEDQRFNYIHYLENAKKTFYKILKNNSLNSQTYFNIQNFIFRKDKSSLSTEKCKNYLDDDIEYSWGDMEEWCSSHSQKHPYKALLDDKHYFSNYIDEFKQTIEIRPDKDFSEMLLNFIQDSPYLSQEIKGNLDFGKSYMDCVGSIRAYVDLRQLFFAIGRILQWVDENKTQSQKLILDLEESKEKAAYELSLFHVGSKLRVNDDKIKGLSGDFLTIRESLFSVVDWKIVADRLVDGKESSIIIDCLNEKTMSAKKVSSLKFSLVTPNKCTVIEKSPGGVNYIFTIYKSTQNDLPV